MSGYRKRFVQYNMLLIGIVLTIVMGTVAVYSARESYMRVRMTMEQIVTPLQNYSQPPKDSRKISQRASRTAEKKAKIRIFSRCFTRRMAPIPCFLPTIPSQKRSCRIC